MSEQKRKLFGTDGIRGAFGAAPMTPEFIYRCGKAAAEHFGTTLTSPLFIIGRDTRESGQILENALCQGLEDGGAKVEKIGVLPTAAISLLTVHQQAAAGIMISASHNEYSDNGIKFFGPEGFKLSDVDEAQLEERIEAQPHHASFSFTPATNFDHSSAAFEIYAATLIKSLPTSFSLQGLPIFVDAAHGAAWQSTPKILNRLGANVHLMAAEPDGTNINAACGSLHPKALQLLMRENLGGIGLCHDGDADRVVLLDEDAEPLDGDELLAIVGLHAASQGKLPKNTIVATLMSNLGLDEAFHVKDGSVIRSNVGDRYVLEAMQQGGYQIGGEQSGHMLFLHILPTGDGLLSALQVLQVMVAEKKPLRELRRVMQKYPQKLTNLQVREKKPFAQIAGLSESIQDVENEMGTRGRLLLRYSGTENKLRLLLEYADATQLDRLSEQILRPIRTNLNLNPLT
ncbi:MAG: phosphoglucosamine mutase [Blastochloris sp.]|nr:phosphoglucosamine mutase [Blastochloris sp.]